MNRRDIELLSSYLDGQLKPSETARLESRLSADPDLRAVLNDLRSARGLLRQLPMRKAPRNFTLTPKMVGKNPPLPRSYWTFRFVTALASVLLFFTLGLNFLGPQMTASQTGFGGFGGGGGGGPEISQQAPAAAESLATESAGVEAPPEEPSILAAPATPTVFAADSATRELQTPNEKQGVTNHVNVPPQVPSHPLPIIPSVWVILLAAIALLGGLVMVLIRQAAASRWRK